MQNSWSYIKGSIDFISKTENLKLTVKPDKSPLVTTDMVELYLSISHVADLRALREALDKQDKKFIRTEGLAEFVLKSNVFEFNMKIKQQASTTTISKKLAPPYTCLFMDKFQTSFLETQQLQPLVWFRYVEDISLYGRMERKNLIVF